MDWPQLLIAILGAGGFSGLGTWAIRNRIEAIRAAQERLASDRRRLYADIVDPYVRIFAASGDHQKLEEIKQQILSVEYRKTALEIVLIGSDEVVDSYNDLMQHFYRMGGSTAQEPVEVLDLLGRLLVAIRRSLGNSATELDQWDMLRHMINDLEQSLARAGIVWQPHNQRRASFWHRFLSRWGVQ